MHRTCCRAKFKTKDHPIINHKICPPLTLALESVLLLFSFVALCIAIVGMTDAGAALSPVVTILARAINTVNGYIGDLIYIVNITNVGFFEFQNVLYGTIETKFNVSTANATIINLQPVVDWLSGFQIDLCSVEQYGTPVFTVLLMMAVVPFSLVLTGILLMTLGVIRKKGNALSLGGWFMFTGLIILALLFALVVPSSVFMDDFCYSANEYFQTGIGEFIISCLDTPSLRAPLLRTINFTNNFIYITTADDTQTFNNLVERMAFGPIPVVEFRTSEALTNSEIAYSAANYSLPPVLQFLVQSQKNILSDAYLAGSIRNRSDVALAWANTLTDTTAIQALQLLYYIYAYIGDCHDVFWKRLLEALNLYVCTSLKEGFLMTVWAVACLLLFIILFMVLFIFVGRFYISKLVMPYPNLWIGALLSMALSISLSGSIVVWRSDLSIDVG